MFNSLGNLAMAPTAALLIIDYATGTTLHLSGAAAVAWTPPGAAGDDGGTGRLIRFTLEAVLTGPPLPLRCAHTSGYPRNPPLTKDPQP